MKMKIYIAGQIRRERNRFGLPIDCSIAVDDYPILENKVFEFDTLRYEYTGPYTIGCDHGCAHVYDHAVGPVCGDDYFPHIEGHGMRIKLRQLVCQQSLSGIDDANIVFAWLGDNSHDAHGTIAEIGYAKGRGKPILIGHMPYDTNETWFVKMMATKTFIADDPLTAFRDAMRWINTHGNWPFPIVFQSP